MQPKSTILVTGGAGYIGSHTCVELLNAGFDVVAVDNFCNSKPGVLDRVAQIAGRQLPLVVADLRDRTALEAVFARWQIHSVVHFAGLKAVGQSVDEPLSYYQNNVTGTLVLLEVMQAHGCRNLVFSSSATVYGDPSQCPIAEDAPIRPTNPYGSTKAMIERILFDLAASDPSWKMALLRYFNPIGAHPSGAIGEDPQGIPNNLAPYVAQVAVGKRTHLTVHGNDYSTRDGTGERDYIHVVDLARGHIAALNALTNMEGATAINLGTGRASTVLEMVRAFSRASGRDIPYVLGSRRTGDIACCYADAGLAWHLLGWKAEFDLAQMCADAWRWQQQNPDGYPVAEI